MPKSFVRGLTAAAAAAGIILLCSPAFAAKKTKEQQVIEFYERGESYRAAGDCASAVREFDKAIAIRPHDGVITVTTPGAKKMVKRQLVTTPGKTEEFAYYPNRGKAMCQGGADAGYTQQDSYAPPAAAQQAPPPQAQDPGEWGTVQAQVQTQPQPAELACPACKTPFSAGAKFCINCGAALPSPPSTQTQEAGEWGAAAPTQEAGEWGADAGTAVQSQGGGDGWDVDTSNLPQTAPDALPQQQLQFRGPQPIMGNTGAYMCPFTSYGTVAPWADKAAKAKASGAIGGGVGAIAGQQLGKELGKQLGIPGLDLLGGLLGKKAAQRGAEKAAINAAGGMEAIREQSDMSFGTLGELADFLALNFAGHKDYKIVTDALGAIYPKFPQFHNNALRSAHRRY